MDTHFPQEVVDNIVEFLPEDELSKFATVSRKWQKAVENYNFRYFTIDHTKEEDMEGLATIVFPKHRHQLRILRLRSPLQLGYRIPEAFNKTLLRFFQLVAGSVTTVQEALESRNRGTTLELSWHYQADAEDFGFAIDSCTFTLPPVTPVMRGISTLRMIMCCADVRVRLYTAVELAMATPDIKRLEILANTTRPILTLRCADHVRNRISLRAALLARKFLSHTNLQEVCLMLEPTDGVSHMWIDSYTSLVPRQFDLLSSAVRMWSYTLVSLDVQGLFDSSLFWPDPAEKLIIGGSVWNRLKNFHARLRLETPTGNRYFVARTGSNFENKPHQETLQPLFSYWADALGHMPVLEKASVAFTMKFEVISERNAWCPMDWMVEYQAPNNESPNPRLFFQYVRG
ncbi:uncharacterized protein F4822DRAFT_29151 [Hypoxylon trugodes]|uniref:uncharacterized protein n=1 Tax=Hypoxylon trugodes TaxID=326681 RepID=UPI002190C958|nr:uncharacterized protein F4822DRAFT_29151 [Hypoxylon trugodes]KAI1393891.1 hypothetical protein F4822DRAFT_29151 [Hypoxylon trugodes]